MGVFERILRFQVRYDEEQLISDQLPHDLNLYSRPLANYGSAASHMYPKRRVIINN